MKATIETVTLYHVTSNTELTEGRGSTVTVGWFLDRELAVRAGKGQYVMGTDCPIEMKPRRVARAEDGTMWTLGEQITVTTELPAEVRKRALAKLTAEERKALGV